MFANTYLHNNIIHTYYLLHVTVIFLNRVRRHRRAAPPHVRCGDIKAKKCHHQRFLSPTTYDAAAAATAAAACRRLAPPPLPVGFFGRSVSRCDLPLCATAAAAFHCLPPVLPPLSWRNCSGGFILLTPYSRSPLPPVSILTFLQMSEILSIDE